MGLTKEQRTARKGVLFPARSLPLWLGNKTKAKVKDKAKKPMTANSFQITAELWREGEHEEDIEVVITCNCEIGNGLACRIVRLLHPLAQDIVDCKIKKL